MPLNKESEKRTVEWRSFPTNFEIRGSSLDGGGKLRGHAAVFDKWTDLGYLKEKVAKGAFATTIQEDDIRALWNHDPNYILGRNRAGTLFLEEDDKGLAIDITPPDTSYAKDLMVSIRRKDVTQMSFGFEIVKEDLNHERNERIIQEVILWDVSPVTFPAYPETDIYVRKFLRVEPKRGSGMLLDLLRRRLFLRTRQG